jgi:hypothetical protein
MDEQPREEFHDRLTRRLRTGLLVGLIGGAVVGAVIGAIAGGGRLPSILMWSMLGLAGLVVGGIWGGFGGLENPDPGAEPTQSAEPVRDPATSEESDRSLGER